MVHKVVLPKFDANITEATIGAWHRREGDRVEAGDVLVDVITDKANFELEAEGPGVLRRILAPEKSQVPLGYVVALIAEPGEELPDVSAENEKLMAEYRASVTGKALSAPKADTADTTSAPRPVRVRATPRARRLAREAGVDLAEVEKSATGDVVTESDVEKWIEERKP
ncbi:MAG TPA: biotin/lipoyl-containing protein [Planctomycetota bacterium]|nr:biotin/lipoyl-containing protein [Planctomycetota bacterium]